MARRITRKQLKKDDEFLSAAELIFRWSGPFVVGGELVDGGESRRRIAPPAPGGRDL